MKEADYEAIMKDVEDAKKVCEIVFGIKEEDVLNTPNSLGEKLLYSFMLWDIAKILAGIMDVDDRHEKRT